MNYRHAYHAGNFADVVKHAVLALCIEHLKRKDAPFRVMDVHAGAGRYDLAGEEAGRTLEWADGIGRLLGVDAQPPPADAAQGLAPYLDVVRRFNPDGRLACYPGSPLIARALLRDGDRLVANELHPQDHVALARELRGDKRVKVLALDAWMAVKSLLPPPERRGLLLIDPPFEERDEFERLAAALIEARRRFETGMMLLWHPIKDPSAVADFRRAAAGAAKGLHIELFIRAPVDEARFNGCALFVANPPWTLRERLEALLPFLASRLAQGAGARGAVIETQ